MSVCFELSYSNVLRFGGKKKEKTKVKLRERNRNKVKQFYKRVDSTKTARFRKNCT